MKAEGFHLQLAVLSLQSAVGSFQSAAISYQLSAISYQKKATSCQLSEYFTRTILSYQLSENDRQWVIWFTVKAYSLDCRSSCYREIINILMLIHSPMPLLSESRIDTDYTDFTDLCTI